MQRPELVETLVDDETGVSPVIGVILMVAVTVIIAAVIGSSVLGLADSVSETPPQANFAHEQDVVDIYNNGGVLENARVINLRHTSGENIDQDNIRVTVNGEPAYGPIFRGTNADGERLTVDDYYDGGEQFYGSVVVPFDNAGDSINAGDEFTILFSGSIVNDFIEANEDEYSNPIGHITMPHNENIFLFNDGTLRYHSDYYNDFQFEEGDTVRIIWEGGDRSQVLHQFEVGQF